MDSRFNAGIEHATSSNGVNFTYVNRAVNGFKPVQDVKAFSYAGTTYYVACGYDSVRVWRSVQTSLNSFVPVATFGPYGSADAHLVTTGWVQDGTRIYGILYGASATSVTDNNKQIFARWLQKKVVFRNNAGGTWDLSTGLGPTIGRLAINNAIETGTISVYDTDGTTLLYTSPQLSVRPGDVWSYAGP